jgi:hypothetical protein
MKYLIAKTVRPRGKGYCVLGSVEKVPQRSDLRFGKPYLSRWPEDIQFTMEPDFPKDIALADSMENISMLLAVSEKFKQALEAIPGALNSNEVLPVKVVNHKKRVEKGPHYIIHQINHPPCLDEAQSTGTRSALDPKEFQFLDTMVLDPAKIAPDLMLFRPAQFSDFPLVREDLADKLAALNLTGIEFHELEGFEFQ